MQKLLYKMLQHRKLVLLTFAAGLVLCAFLSTRVQVNPNLADYLPQDSKSTQSIQVMGQEFQEDLPNGKLMVTGISLQDAEALEEKMEGTPGVTNVTFATDSNYTGFPLQMMSESTLRKFYRDECALYTLTLDSAYDSSLLTTLRKEAKTIGTPPAGGRKTYVSGDFAQSKFLMESARKEIAIIVVLAVLFCIFLLVLTLDSYAEPVLLIVCLITAVILNSGTNLVFGTVSSITNIASYVLQMAVSVDYFIFILHRYREYQNLPGTPEEHMVRALTASASSVCASSVTTMIGFMALCIMDYRIGFNMGMVLTKGILFSLFCAFTMLPCIILTFGGLIRKTRHRPLIKSARRLSSVTMKIRRPACILFLCLVIPAIFLQAHNHYYYGTSNAFSASSVISQDQKAIEKTFGNSNQMVLLVPYKEVKKEAALVQELEALPETNYVISYQKFAGTAIPAQALPSAIRSQLVSDRYSRIVLEMDLKVESAKTFRAVRKVKALARAQFGNDYYLAGTSVSTEDLKTVIAKDNIKVNLAAAGAVLLVLILTFRELLLPLLLTMMIEGCIWISMAIPFLLGSHLYYVGYLIVSSILLGSTVDYAILVTTRFREEGKRLADAARKSRPNRAILEAAMAETISRSAISVMISGLVLTVSGFLLYFICANGMIGQVGLLLARGTIMALLGVLFALPQLLILRERIRKG